MYVCLILLLLLCLFETYISEGCVLVDKNILCGLLAPEIWQYYVYTRHALAEYNIRVSHYLFIIRHDICEKKHVMHVYGHCPCENP